MTRGTTGCLFLSFVSLTILLFGFISFNLPEILAEGTDESAIKEATQPAETEIVSRNRENVHETTNAVITEEIATEAIWFGFEKEVAIATRHETPVGKAPSVVTVITAEEIKNLGYRTFVEILRTVPGFELLKNGARGAVFPSTRGLGSANKVRLMLNGHLVNDPFRGEAFFHFDDFPVENIKRIEIVRGPGSALYGENAFSAVINIITFDAKDIDGVKMSDGYGSFDTEEGNVVFGKTYGKVDVSGMVRYRHTDGFDGIVESDVVTQIDDALPNPPFSPASQAPGRVEDWRQEYDLNLKVTYKDFYFEGLYINKNQGVFTSSQFALNDESEYELNYVFGEVGYKKTFDDKFTIKPRIYYD